MKDHIYDEGAAGMSEEKRCPNCGNEQNGILPCPHSAALGAAEAQLAAVTKEAQEAQGYYESANDIVFRLQAENTRLRRIAGYARHMDNCQLGVMSCRICTCGLDAALNNNKKEQ